MTLTIEHKVFLLLLRSGLWNTEISEYDLFPLTDVQWERVLSISKEQTVPGLIYCGINKLPVNLQPSSKLMFKLIVLLDYIERGNIKQIESIVELHNKFKKNSIEEILIKGQSVARLYLNPYLRTYGDIDYYFNQNNYVSIIKFLDRNNITYQRSADSSVTFNYKGMPVELHNAMVDIENPFKQDYINDLIANEGFNYIDLDGTSIKVPNEYLNILIINTHILKHILGWGIGLRQFCDLAILYKEYHGKIDGEKLRQIYEKLGILKWSRLVHSLLVSYLGLETKYIPYKDKQINSYSLIKTIFKNGNFGFNCRDMNARNSNVKSKILTALAFLNKIKFALSYSASEEVWVIYYLIINNIKLLVRSIK